MLNKQAKLIDGQALLEWLRNHKEAGLKIDALDLVLAIQSGRFDIPTESEREVEPCCEWENVAKEAMGSGIKLAHQVKELREENKRLQAALEEILRVTHDGSVPDEWDGSTGGSGHAKCRKIAREALSTTTEPNGGNG